LSLFAWVWCAAVLVKIVVMRSRREPYQFGQWDGGTMLRGKTLGSNGTIGMCIFVITLGAVATYQLVRWSAL
jgi:hypothetical protein